MEQGGCVRPGTQLLRAREVKLSVPKELISHWEENGLDAIDRTCKEQPAAYLRAVLSLVPKDFAMTVERDEIPQHIEVRFI